MFRVPSVPKPFRVPSVLGCLVLRVPSGCQPIIQSIVDSLLHLGFIYTKLIIQKSGFSKWNLILNDDEKFDE